jgi:hypothetical protein
VSFTQVEAVKANQGRQQSQSGATFSSGWVWASSSVPLSSFLRRAHPMVVVLDESKQRCVGSNLLSSDSIARHSDVYSTLTRAVSNLQNYRERQALTKDRRRGEPDLDQPSDPKRAIVEMPRIQELGGFGPLGSRLLYPRKWVLSTLFKCALQGPCA